MNSTVTPHELAMALKRSLERMERNGDGLPTREKMLMDAPRLWGRAEAKAVDRAAPSGPAAAGVDPGGGRGTPPF